MHPHREERIAPRKFKIGVICSNVNESPLRRYVISKSTYNSRTKEWWYRLHLDDRSVAWACERVIREIGDEEPRSDFEFDLVVLASTYGRPSMIEQVSFGGETLPDTQRPSASDPSEEVGADFQQAEYSDSESIVSLADSVFSMTSTASSESSIAGSTTAREQLLDLLIMNDEIQDLLKVAFEQISVERFRRNFARLLKIYASDLDSVARNFQEKEASLFVRKQRHILAYRIGETFPSLVPSLGQEETMMSSDVKGIQSEDSDSDDETELDSDLERIRTFLIAGLPFKNLKQNFRRFLYPIQSQVNPKDVEREGNYVKDHDLSTREPLVDHVEK